MKNFTKFLGGNRSGMLKVLLVVIGMVWGVCAYTQVISDYSFSTSTSGSLTDISTGSTQLVASGTDDGSSSVTNIGFNFNLRNSYIVIISIT